MERRRAERRALDVGVRVGHAGELLLPRARAVDVSTTGVLLTFDEPVGLFTGQTVVASFDVESASTHLMGHVRRCARGTDFRSYVAIEFDERYADEAIPLMDRLARLADPPRVCSEEVRATS